MRTCGWLDRWSMCVCVCVCVCDVVDSVRPRYGPWSGGTNVTITGRFLSKDDVRTVYFGNDRTRFVDSSANLLVTIGQPVLR